MHRLFSSSSSSFSLFWPVLISFISLFALPFAKADFPLGLVCSSAPWPVRIQPAFQTISQSLTAYIPSEARDLVFRPGSVILYGGIGSNDVWISQTGSRIGQTWYLIAGIVRNPYLANHPIIGSAPSPYDRDSFVPRYTAAVCEDPTGDRAYLMAGSNEEGNVLADVWSTLDGRTWEQQSIGEWAGRSWSSCIVTNDQTVILTGGLGQSYPTYDGFVAKEFNDVWISTSYGANWRMQTNAAPWGGRYETLFLSAEMPVAKGVDTLYVMGGKHDRNGELEGYYNGQSDIWVSSDSGKTWLMLTTNAPWTARWGHSGVITKDGIIAFFGGGVRDEYYDASNQPYAYWGDIWASFDGGYTWAECSQGRGTSYNRTEAAVILDSNGHMIIAAGYSIRQPRGHGDVATLVWNNDVVRTEFSLERDEMGTYDGGRRFAEICGVTYPYNGEPGLKVWPVPQYNAAKGLTAGLIAMFFFTATVITCYFWTRHVMRKYKEFRWPTPSLLKEIAINAVPLWVSQSSEEDQSMLGETNTLSDSLLEGSQEGVVKTAPTSTDGEEAS